MHAHSFYSAPAIHLTPNPSLLMEVGGAGGLASTSSTCMHVSFGRYRIY